MHKRPPLVNLSAHDYPFVTPPELAEYLACDRRTILRMIENGALKAYRVGRNWRIATSEALRAFPVEHTRRGIA